MSPRTPASRTELVPLDSRIRWTLAFRVLLALAPVAIWVLLPAVRTGGWAPVAVPAALYLAFNLLAWPLSRGPRRTALGGFLASLLVDGLFLAWCFHALSALDGPVGALVTLHVIGVTLLVSFRSGLRVAMWHSLLAFTVLQAEAAQVLGATDTAEFPAVGFATYLVTLWITGLLTATFAAVNERELRRRRYDVEVLRRFALSLEGTNDAARILALLADLARTELLAPRVLAVFDPLVDATEPGGSGVRGTVVTLDGAAPPVFDEAPDVFPEGAIIRQAVERREPVLSRHPDPVTDEWLLDRLPGVSHVIAVPFVLEGQLVGALLFEHGAGRRYGRTERVERRVVATAQQATAQAAMALGRAILLTRLRAAAETDGLTEVANRRMFDATLEREVAQAKRAEESFAVALVDLDFFKSLNDQHGHLVGDDVLRRAARAIRETCREGDLAARYGGEEFAVIFTHVTAEQAGVAAERVRAAIERAGGPVAVTASVGVATFPDHAGDARELLSCADAALYLAKSSGRNRVVVAGRGDEKPRMVPRPRAAEARPASGG